MIIWDNVVGAVYVRLTKDMYRQYRLFYFSDDIRQMAIGLVLVGLVISVFGYSDYLIFGPTAQFYLLLALRLSMLAATAAVIVVLLKAVREPATYDLLILVFGLCVIICSIYIGTTRPGNYFHYTAVDVAIVVGIYLFFSCRRIIKVALALLLSAGDLLVIGLVKEPMLPLVWNVTITSFVLANFVGILFALRMEAYRRRRFLDMLDEQRMRGELVRMASVDELTGIWNRRKFLELAEIEASRYIRYQRPYSLMMIDLDYFKTVNDRFGHISGDVALRQFAAIVRGQIRSTDIFGRLGGEEFGIVLPETGLDEALVLGGRIGMALRSTDINVSEECTVRITASIGMAEACPGQTTLDDVISAADTALYRAKASGRDCIEAAASGVSQTRLEM